MIRNKKRVTHLHTTLEPLEPRRLMSTVFGHTNIVSDGAVAANVVDPHLVNPWGLAIDSAGVLWTSDNGTGFSTLYGPAGSVEGAPVAIHPPAAGGPSLPTGVIDNEQNAFPVSENGVTGDAQFVFDTIRGTIAGWSPNVDGVNAITVVDNSASGAQYTGLAVAGLAGSTLKLYAANFGQGKIDVFDQNFHPITVPGGFTDPNLPTGFKPFNVQNVEGKIYVMYSKVDPTTGRAALNVGNGIVDVFGKLGVMQERLATHGDLAAPWGVAVAPSTFGAFANKILVGDFGDGHINVFGRKGAFLGQLMNASGRPIALNRLWALTRGPAGTSEANTLFLTAGIGNETHGILATLNPSTTAPASLPPIAAAPMLTTPSWMITMNEDPMMPSPLFSTSPILDTGGMMM